MPLHGPMPVPRQRPQPGHRPMIRPWGGEKRRPVLGNGGGGTGRLSPRRVGNLPAELTAMARTAAHRSARPGPELCYPRRWCVLARWSRPRTARPRARRLKSHVSAAAEPTNAAGAFDRSTSERARATKRGYFTGASNNEMSAIDGCNPPVLATSSKLRQRFADNKVQYSSLHWRNRRVGQRHITEGFRSHLAWFETVSSSTRPRRRVGGSLGQSSSRAKPARSRSDATRGYAASREFPCPRPR